MTDTPSPGAADAAPVAVYASARKPTLPAGLRWLLTLLGAWMVKHGFQSGDQAVELASAGPGALIALGSLAWSIEQKQLAKRRLVAAALARPERVVLR